MTPTLIEPPSPNGLPIAYASLPWRTAAGLPRMAGTRLATGSVARTTAMSFSGWRATISPLDWVPSAKVSLISVASATTWRLVRMSPSRVTTTPLPSPPSSSGLPAFAGALGLDQHERGQDRLVDERREGRRGRDRGERVGHGVIDVLLRERRTTGDERAVEEDRQEGDDGARHERRRAAKARPEAIGSRRDVRSSSRRIRQPSSNVTSEPPSVAPPVARRRPSLSTAGGVREVYRRFARWAAAVACRRRGRDRPSQIVTALPDTLTPSSPGTTETVSWLGRPISTPWTISNEAGGVISPRARR